MMRRFILTSFWVLLFIFSSLFHAIKLYAQDKDEVKLSEIVSIGKTKQDVTVYLGGSRLSPHLLIRRTQTALDEIYSKFILVDSIPDQWNIVFHGEWKLGAGYYHRDFQVNELPTILLVPKTDAQFLSRVISHELVHLIHESYRPTEEGWIQRGSCRVGRVSDGSHYTSRRSRFNPVF